MSGQVHRHGRPTIGVLAGWQFYRSATTLSYLAPLYRGISRAARDVGSNVLIGCGMGLTATATDRPRPAWPAFAPDVDFVPIAPANVDGLLIINPLHSPQCACYAQSLIDSKFPVLFIGAGEHGPTIRANNSEGALEAMRHLIGHGHRQIAFLAGSPEDLDGDSGDRLNTYHKAVRTYDLADDPRLVVYGRHVYDGGYAATQQLLASRALFTAILASNDESAIGAMNALRDAGRSVPDDVAIIGFDDRLEGTVQDPPLTTMRIPLFNMGYRAVESLYLHLEGRRPLAPIEQVDTCLIRRKSCGCSDWQQVGQGLHAASRGDLAQAIAAVVTNQAQSLAEHECAHLSRQLVESFTDSLQQNAPAPFESALQEVLKETSRAGEDAHLWQDAVSMLTSGTTNLPLADQLLRQARVTISGHMQRQHRQHVVNQRWISSRLGLLTADLLTALDEPQIFGVLGKHLAEMNIHTALIVLFEEDGEWSLLRDATQPDRAPVRFRTGEFPPPGFLDDSLFRLAMLPLVQPNGQRGFVAFDTEQLDYYGDIVQEIAGALNAARLYREAVEGQRLAEEANLMKSRFLSTVSHELRTPLNIIVGLSGILLQESNREQQALPEASRRDVERIHSQAQHLGGLIGDVLDLASSDARQLRLNYEYVDLVGALRLVIETGRQLATEKGLIWQADLPETSVWVWGDRVRLRQVVLNLISNAVKFTAHGSITLTLQPDTDSPDSVTVSVQDTGLGIPAAEQDAIFDEFRQSARTVSQGYGGLGLGLAICKRLIEMHGGKIGVRSNNDAGSIFHFTLATVLPPIAPPPEFAPKEHNVLLLTTPTDASQRLRNHLDQQGFTVQMMLMDDLAGWQSALIETPPDAIVLDASATSRPAWEVLRTAVGSPALQGVPLLFYASDHARGALLELDYLTKPIRHAELRRTLERILPNAVTPTGETHTGRVFLVVDDDPNTLEMHVRIVQAQSADNRVLQAHDGREALDILNRESVDLVLLDLMMPELDGFGVLEAMREHERTRDVPVIILTGRTLTEDDMARLNRGVSTVLSKGVFSVDETLAHITAALERKRKLNSETQRLVRQAMAYLHERYAEPVSRHDIAQHVGLVEDYLTHCFRQELGMTPIAYLNRYRISQARRLLRETEQPITEIALAVGFSDNSYFSRIFRRETGTSPEAFRRG